MSDTAPVIVVPTDLSEGARAALERALPLARAMGATIVLVNVVDTSALVVGGIETYLDIASIARSMRADAEKEVARLAEERDPGRKTITEAVVVEGRPATAIVDLATERKASMIVIGTHGRTGIARLMLGSVAERVAREARCDVLVVHAPSKAK